MDIVLTSLSAGLTNAWKRFCGDLPNVTIYQGSILDVPCDAVVSPANSFGFMDGGIDAIYTDHFGEQVQERLQALIREKHHGELVVGAAEIVTTGDARISYVIAAPTMRVPMILKDSVNPYLAARATLLLVKYGVFAQGPLLGQPVNQAVKRIAFPGLGTGVGRVSSETCAYQMRHAIEEVIFEKANFPTSWWEAQERHQKLYTDAVRDLQFEEYRIE